MRRGTPWLSLGLLLSCLILVQVSRHQAAELAVLEDRVRAQRAAASQLQAELEAVRVELGVRNVLDAHDINVPRPRLQAIAGSIIDVSRRYDLPPELILAVIFTESRFDVRAESPKGAVGLMQLMPATALAIAQELELEWKGKQLLTDPQINILLGGSYLRHLLHLYREEGLAYALAAYNVGPTRLRALLRERGRPPARYAEMVRRVSEAFRRDYF